MLNLLSNLKIYLIIALICLLLGAYVSYRLTSEHFEAKIQSAANQAQKEKDAIQQQGDQIVAKYVQQINQISTERDKLQKQVPTAVGFNNCRVSSGFVRLFNTSTADVPSAPSLTDVAPTPIDPVADTAPSQVAETDVLSIAIENNLKYEQVSKQLIDLQNFLKDRDSTINH